MFSWQRASACEVAIISHLFYMLFSPFILSTILQKYALDIYLTDEKNDAYTYETCSHSYTPRTKREARFVPRVFFFLTEFMILSIFP